ncbi:MAG: hypothetical protein NTY02_01270 [Acidobacteria bacterium]|nr:hypothetical protein [Acidobacteriota bacterium]
MSDKKNWGQTVLGWFVVSDEEGTEPVAPPVQSDDAASGTPRGGDRVFVSNPPAATGGKVDFDAVFEAAGIGSEERQRVVKTAELLGTLPAETPTAVKKQIVEASLNAFGVPIDKIIEAGVAEIQALEGYIRAGAADTQQVLADGEERIKGLEQQITQLRAVMEARVQEQQGAVRASNERKLGIQQILEFFGQEAVARVVQASPKLQTPPR